ncbi:MAG: hybrid sensor histidine kinase/response regulator, partial [Desulfobulbaceae bacterium]|nr:hybrid sensor histidine kinase/response regulator [Desulfobulbaceae bacterium]
MSEPLERAKVLIVDDTPENLDILMEALSGSHAVVAARDGEKALRIATGANPPDLIILDVMMPGMDGYEVCRRLQGDPVTRAIPVLFLTALADEASELLGLTLGAVDYIHKPISIPLVQARVRTHLQLVRARRQLAGQVAALTEAARLREDVDRIMRHDLKTPLNPVIGFTSLMRGSAELTDKHRSYVEMIHGAGLKMLDMINRSLDLFKMESGTYDFRPAAVDLEAVARRVAEDLSLLAAERKVSVELAATQVFAQSDEMLCYSMLSNLVKNGIEAAPAQGVVTIGLAVEGEYAVVGIHNQGVVPEAVRPTFFDKYSTAGKHGGTGLGTYSARLMAQTMRGTIG